MAGLPSGAVVERLWTLFEARRWDDAGALLAEDVEVRWPHTGERFRGRDAVIRVNRDYPEPWRVEVLQVVAEGERVACDVAVTHAGGTSHAAGFYLVRDGLVRDAVEYWMDEGAEAPPVWREGYGS